MNHARRKIKLRALQRTDLPLTLEWRNKERVRRWFVDSRELVWEEHVRWFEAYEQREYDLTFVICDRDDGARPIGQIAIYNLADDTAEFGRLMIGEDDALGKGFAKQASELLIDIAKGLGVKELRLNVFKGNLPAIAIYRKLGFVEVPEGDACLLHMRRYL